MPLKFLFLPVCLVFSVNIPAAQLAPEHQWSAAELSLLKTLWIKNLNQQVDNSNHVVNNSVAVDLGHRIFFDKRFSSNGNIACASCHHPDKYFTDGRKTAKGLSVLTRNAPTVVGSSHHTWFFLDGRSDSLWSQALGPLENEKEHGGNRSQYAHLVFNDPVLRNLYEKIFGSVPDISDLKRFPVQAGPVKNKAASNAWKAMNKKDKQIISKIFVNIGKAIAAYETKLQPAASRFDNYIKALLNNDTAEMQKQLSSDEVKGLRIFVSKAKCIVCHSGPMLTDKSFHNISIPPRKGDTGKNLKHDWGRYTGARQVLNSPFNCRSQYNDNKNRQCDELEYIVMDRHETQGAFKTPSLRNVSKTAPYMHAGQLETLREVIEHYDNPPPVIFRKSELFLNFNLNTDEVLQLEAFLKTLDSPVNAPARLLDPPGQN